MIQSYEILYIPGRNCDQYRNFISIYSHVTPDICRSLLVMGIEKQFEVATSTGSRTRYWSKEPDVPGWGSNVDKPQAGLKGSGSDSKCKISKA